MSIVHQSDFTATDGTNVTSLTPTTGSALVSLGGLCLVTSNRARRSDTIANIRTDQTIPSADYAVKGTVRNVATTSNQLFFLYARGVDTSNTYRLLWYSDNGAFEMHRIVTGTPTLIGSATVTPSVGVDYVWELRCSGTTISAWVDGTQVIGPITDSTYSAAGFAAFGWNGGTSPDTTGVHLDTFVVDTIEAGGGGGGGTIAGGRYRVASPVR